MTPVRSFHLRRCTSAIPYLDNGQMHDYVPGFVIRLAGGIQLILKTQGYDERAEVKELSHIEESTPSTLKGALAGGRLR